MVLALAKLHNFCMDEKQSIENLTAKDISNIEQVGGVPLEVDHDINMLVPRQLLDVGDHFEGLDRSRQLRRLQKFNNVQLPRERLLASVVDQDLRRPQARVQH